MSFRPTAWVYAETHKIRLKGVLGPINDYLAEKGSGLKGVVFEDNLSSHQTESVLDFWDKDLPQFTRPVFMRLNMTDIIQVIDRHIGVRYKKAVYRAFRVEMMCRLKVTRDAAGTNEGGTVPPLNPKEECILITKAIADTHEMVIKSEAYRRLFVATSTWLPIDHLLKDDSGSLSGPKTIPEESEVDLQHLPEYKYRK